MALIKGKQLAANTVTLGKLQAIDEAKLLVGAANGQITAVALSSDATITAAGALTISDSAITTVKIADTSVTTGKLADDAVTLAKIADAAFASDFTLGEAAKLPTVSVVKTYVDSVAQGLDVKDSVTVIALANLDIAASIAGSVVDGIALADGQRVLLAGQTTASENGIYIVKAAAVPERAADFASGLSAAGAFTFVEQGTTYADTGWVCSTNQGSAVVGTDALAFTQFSSAGIVLAGDALEKDGNTLNVLVDDATLEIVANSLRIASSGVDKEHIAAAALGDALSGGAGTAISVTAHSQASVGVHSTGLYAAVPQLQQFAASATAADGDSAAATTIAKTPAADSAVQVFVNGVLAKLTGDKLGDCYFSGDAGVNARALADIASGDSLRWNGSLAGYELEASDLVTLVYSALNVPT